MDDLNQAIISMEQAVVSTPSSRRNRAPYLGNLASALGCRFARTQSMDDINRAIALTEEAIVSIPQNHPSRSLYLYRQFE